MPARRILNGLDTRDLARTPTDEAGVSTALEWLGGVECAVQNASDPRSRTGAALAALGSDLIGAFIEEASLRGIAIDSLRACVAASGGPDGKRLRVTLEVETETDDPSISRVLANAEQTATMLGVLRGAVPVVVDWIRL